MIFADKISKKLRMNKGEELDMPDIDISSISRKIARTAYLMGVAYQSKKKVEEKLDIQTGIGLLNQAQSVLSSGNQVEALRLINLARRYLR